MREIVIISGKGGTGKTTVTATLAALLVPDVVVADCDVDAADLHLLLQPVSTRQEAFHSGKEPTVNADACTGCGACERACRFSAIQLQDSLASIEPFLCEGCGYCARICPAGAITMQERYVGQFMLSRLQNGCTMAHARLAPGGENSGKLVMKVKNEARAAAEQSGCPLVLVDGSPGIGCPVISSLSGAHYVLLVTEPTLSALHDLDRVVQLLAQFGLPAGCVLNKSDMNPGVAHQVRRFLEEHGIPVLAEIPYDERVLQAIRTGKTPTEYDAAFLPVFTELLSTLPLLEDTK